MWCCWHSWAERLGPGQLGAARPRLVHVGLVVGLGDGVAQEGIAMIGPLARQDELLLWPAEHVVAVRGELQRGVRGRRAARREENVLEATLKFRN